MQKYFSIGEVSKLKDITVATLRFYHEKGLLIPKHIDTHSGYRYYTLEQFLHIDIIKGCRSLGTSIEALQELFKSQDTDQLIAFLKEKKEEATQTIHHMGVIIDQIDEICKHVAYGKLQDQNGEVVIKFIKERKLLEVPCHEVGDNKELMDYSALQRKITATYKGAGVQRGIRYALTENGMKPQSVFCVINDNENGLWEKLLPEGDYITITYTKKNQSQQFQKIFQYINENQLIPSLCLEIDLLNDSLFEVDNYSCELQIYCGFI